MDAWKYETAHDLDLAPLARWRSVHRESGLVESCVHSVWWAVVQLYLCLGHRLHIEGSEHLPRHAPFVLVSNHCSHLDALVLASSLPARLRRITLPVAAGDTFFESPTMAAFAAWCLNALPLWRRNAGRHAMDELRRRLIDEPCGYVLFPEGTRSRDGLMAPFKPGIGMIVAGANVCVVPCYVSGTHEAWPPRAKWPRLKRVRVKIGPPLRFTEAGNDRKGWERVAHETEAAVRSLAAA